MNLDVTHWPSEPSEPQPVSEPSESHCEPSEPHSISEPSESQRREWLRHNFLARRGPGYSRPTIPTGDKVRAGLGYAPTQKLMPNLGRPWSELGRP